MCFIGNYSIRLLHTSWFSVFMISIVVPIATWFKFFQFRMRKVLLIHNKTHNFTVLINIFLIFVCWWFKFKHFIKNYTLKAFVWTGCRNFHLFVSDFVVPVDIQFNRLIRLSIVALITGWASKYSIITSISIIPFLQIIMWMSVSVHSFSDKCKDFF